MNRRFMLISLIIASVLIVLCSFGNPYDTVEANTDNASIKPLLTGDDYQIFLPWIVFPESNWNCSPAGSNLGDMFAVKMVSSIDGWMAGTNGCIYRYKDETWRPFPSPTNSTIRSIAMISPYEGWAVGDNGLIIHYLDGEWSTVLSPTTTTLYSVAMNSLGEGWAVGMNTAVHYLNGSWTAETIPLDIHLHSVKINVSGEAWTVGSQRVTDVEFGNVNFKGILLHFDNGAWKLMDYTDSLYLVDFYSISMISDTEGWVVGGYYYHGFMQMPTFYMFNNGTYTGSCEWDYRNVLYDVELLSASDGWAVGAEGIIFHYNGDAWTLITSPASVDLHSISMLSTDEGWAAGSGTVLHYKDGSWQVYGSL